MFNGPPQVMPTKTQPGPVPGLVDSVYDANAIADRRARPWRPIEHLSLSSPLTVAAFLFFGGVCSVLMGADANWDLRNYHFYNPWAWWHGKTFVDLAPAQVQSYYNPLLDLPFFALIQSNLTTVAVCFLMGFPFALGVYFLARIGKIATEEMRSRVPLIVVVSAVILAIMGAAGRSQIGSTMNEWSTSALVLAALFILLRSATSKKLVTPRAAIFSALLLGAATGLKLTASVFAFATFAALAVWLVTRHCRLRELILFSCAGVVGFLATYAFWGLELWSHFRNPFFAYFNALFRSPFWEPVNFADVRFFPKSPLEWIIRPVRLARTNQLATEVPMRDPRFLLLAVLGILAVVNHLARRFVHGKPSTPPPRGVPTIAFLSVFVAVSYVGWLKTFSIYRYTIPIESVGSFLVAVGLWRLLVRVRLGSLSFAFCCLAILAWTRSPDWGRLRVHRGAFFQVTAPTLPHSSMVLILNEEPVSYLVPFFGADPLIVRPVANFAKPWMTNELQRQMRASVRAHAGPIFELQVPGVTHDDRQVVLAQYELIQAEGSCAAIRSNFEPRPLQLCRLVRASESTLR